MSERFISRDSSPPTAAELLARVPPIISLGTDKKYGPKASDLSPLTPKKKDDGKGKK